jgi:hypothetical protein
MTGSAKRRERIAAALWVILAVVVWNGLYDLLLARSTQNYLFRAAIHQAGLGPPADLTTAMDLAVRDAIWISTLWAGIILLAGAWTVRMMMRAHASADPRLERDQRA